MLVEESLDAGVFAIATSEIDQLALDGGESTEGAREFRTFRHQGRVLNEVSNSGERAARWSRPGFGFSFDFSLGGVPRHWRLVLPPSPGRRRGEFRGFACSGGRIRLFRRRLYLKR